MFISGIIGSYIYGELNTPRVQLFEWDVREYSSPVGTRNIYAGHPAWIKELGININKAMEFENVVLNYADDSLSGVYTSRTQCFTIGLANSNFSISNLRLWMPSGTALQNSGHIEYVTSNYWLPNFILPSGSGSVIQTSLPTLQNILRQDGLYGNLDFSEDNHVSQFVYLALSIPSGMPLGLYGKGTNGDLAFRITYDWYYKFHSSGSMT